MDNCDNHIFFRFSRNLISCVASNPIQVCDWMNLMKRWWWANCCLHQFCLMLTLLALDFHYAFQLSKWTSFTRLIITYVRTKKTSTYNFCSQLVFPVLISNSGKTIYYSDLTKMIWYKSWCVWRPIFLICKNICSDVQVWFGNDGYLQCSRSSKVLKVCFLFSNIQYNSQH